jgi:hypothetical protein
LSSFPFPAKFSGNLHEVGPWIQALKSYIRLVPPDTKDAKKKLKSENMAGNIMMSMTDLAYEWIHATIEAKKQAPIDALLQYKLGPPRTIFSEQVLC